MLYRQGELNGTALKAAQNDFAQQLNKNRKLMQLCLDPAARAGQADAINQVYNSCQRQQHGDDDHASRKVMLAYHMWV